MLGKRRDWLLGVQAPPDDGPDLVAGEWITTTVPIATHAYTLASGLVQVLLVALLIAFLVPQTDSRTAS